VGDPQPTDADAELGRQRLEAELVGAGSVADDEAVAPRERVARLEVGTHAVAADVRRSEPAAGEPHGGRRGLHPPLGETHVGQHDVARARGDQRALGALDDEAEVHRVDHVGGVGTLLDDLDLSAGRADRGDQAVPLLAGQGRVGLLGEIHERVDLVVEPKMVRPHHDVPTTPAELSDQLHDQLTRHHTPPNHGRRQELSDNLTRGSVPYGCGG
jgi:hypothetical protein